jgi:WD40 repeat protein
VELDHSIGYSGKIVDSVHLHPSLKEFILVAASSIVVRDLNDPHNQHFLTAHDDQITCLAISNNGQMLASGQRGENSDIVVWNYETKRAIFRLSEHDHEVTALSFSYDDRLLLSVGNTLDGKLFIWNTANGHIVSSLAIIPSIFSEAPNCLTWGGYAKDYKGRDTTNYQFALAGKRKLTLWHLNPATGQTQPELISTGAVVRDYTCMTFSKNREDFLFAGTESGDLLGF